MHITLDGEKCLNLCGIRTGRETLVTSLMSDSLNQKFGCKELHNIYYFLRFQNGQPLADRDQRGYPVKNKKYSRNILKKVWLGTLWFIKEIM